MTVQKLSEELRDFYKNWIVLSKDEIIKLCCDTLQQSRCDRRFELRHLRISASKDVYNVKIRKSVAIEQYQNLFNYLMKNVGVIVNKSQPWLCANLDGFVVENKNICKIVEFKCPNSCKNIPIINHAAKKCNINYLQF